MSETEAMTINERRKYIYKMWGRYRQATKTEKGRLLDEIEAVSGMHRKAILRLLNGRLSRKKRSRERGREYGLEVEDAVRVISRSLDYPCAERLQPRLVWQARHLERHGALRVTDVTVEKLSRISVSTLKRMLARLGRTDAKLSWRLPKRTPGAGLRKAYPMSKIDWQIAQPGHFEVDLVHHAGETVAGEYIHTLQMLDVATGWSEITAVFGRSYRVMADGFDHLLARCPFAILEIHPDNGAEFFNHHLLHYWKTKVPGVRISRSRPYHKNDNRFVEENNRSLIRTYVGHGRFDTPAHLKVLRKLLNQLWLYHNFFQPVMRLQQKTVVSGLHYRPKYDVAQTPFDRLLACYTLPEPVRLRLETLREQTNPLALRADIDRLIAMLLSLPQLKHSQTVNVLDTLIKEVDMSVTLSFEPTILVR